MAKPCSICNERPKVGSRYCRECAAAKFKTPEQRRIEAHRLTVEEYKAMENRQGGRCAICGTVPEKLFIDHDHACCPGSFSCGDCVRGLLCMPCNSGLGFFRDNVATLESAITYLKESK